MPDEKKQSSTTELVVGLILTLMQWVVDMSPLITVLIWLVIFGLFLHVIWRGTLGVKLTTLGKVAVSVVVALFIGFGGYYSYSKPGLAQELADELQRRGQTVAVVANIQPVVTGQTTQTVATGPPATTSQLSEPTRPGRAAKVEPSRPYVVEWAPSSPEPTLQIRNVSSAEISVGAKLNSIRKWSADMRAYVDVPAYRGFRPTSVYLQEPAIFPGFTHTLNLTLSARGTIEIPEPGGVKSYPASYGSGTTGHWELGVEVSLADKRAVVHVVCFEVPDEGRPILLAACMPRPRRLPQSP